MIFSFSTVYVGSRSHFPQNSMEFFHIQISIEKEISESILLQNFTTYARARESDEKMFAETCCARRGSIGRVPAHEDKNKKKFKILSALFLRLF